MTLRESIKQDLKHWLDLGSFSFPWKGGKESALFNLDVLPRHNPPQILVEGITQWIEDYENNH